MRYVHSTLFHVQWLLQVLLTGLFCLSDWGSTTQAVLCGALLCTVGIPHGANDHAYRPNTTSVGLLGFLGVYLGSMGAYLALWWSAPALALLLFFAISLHHFGQSNFENRSVWYLPSLLWGAWVLVFPVLLHWDEAMGIFGAMVGSGVSWEKSASGLSGMWRGLAALLLALFYLLALLRLEREQWTRYLLQWGVVSVWYWLTPLLFGFIVVFCVWHSLQSLQHQLRHFQSAGGGSRRQFFLGLLPFGLLALAGFGGYVYFRGFAVDEAFVLLSLITLPHVVVMHRLYGAPASPTSPTTASGKRAV
ncbi:MAG: Brp/Blh family beta-carotene 15,15'-dioxygenase [Ferruginibacter sp.]|nr:Brp/Blh family beta-carotene 15,15'-dioxygenase [Cytophagales bacterium]